MALTAEQVLDKLYAIQSGSADEPHGESKKILDEWAAQLQPQPDESDEKCAEDIWRNSIVAEGNMPVFMDETKAAAIIARHTAAKVAAAEEKLRVAREALKNARYEIEERITGPSDGSWYVDIRDSIDVALEQMDKE